MAVLQIHFSSLQKAHFPWLLKWLKTSHVKIWWDDDAEWTLEKIEKKYQTYVEGYKILNGKRKTIHVYVIYLSDQPIGYIQAYNAYDFSREFEIPKQFPHSLAAIDLYIGESQYIGQGLGASAILQFLTDFVDPFYGTCLVDPDESNTIAILTYQKAGFHPIKLEETKSSEKILWMLRHRGCS